MFLSMLSKCKSFLQNYNKFPYFDFILFLHHIYIMIFPLDHEIDNGLLKKHSIT